MEESGRSVKNDNVTDYPDRFPKMLTFSFTVGSADDARVAAEVCDFLAERMASSATPSTRRPRGKTTTETSPSESAAVSDPAALYAKLGGTVADVAPVTPKVEPEAAAVVAETREQRVERCRAIAKVRGGKWLGDTMKKLGITNSMSAWTDAEQLAFLAEDVTA